MREIDGDSERPQEVFSVRAYRMSIYIRDTGIDFGYELQVYFRTSL